MLGSSVMTFSLFFLFLLALCTPQFYPFLHLSHSLHYKSQNQGRTVGFCLHSEGCKKLHKDKILTIIAFCTITSIFIKLNVESQPRLSINQCQKWNQSSRGWLSDRIIWRAPFPGSSQRDARPEVLLVRWEELLTAHNNTNQQTALPKQVIRLRKKTVDVFMSLAY